MDKEKDDDDFIVDDGDHKIVRTIIHMILLTGVWAFVMWLVIGYYG